MKTYVYCNFAVQINEINNMERIVVIKHKTKKKKNKKTNKKKNKNEYRICNEFNAWNVV